MPKQTQSQIQQLVEIAAIPPGVQILSPASLIATPYYIIHSSSHSLYIYNRFPQIVFNKAIQVNNTTIYCITANEQYIAVACSDYKIHFYDIRTFEPIREVLLARQDPPISVLFHPHFQETILILYQGDAKTEILGELRSVNVQSGQSFTLVTSIECPSNMTISPHRSEIAILSDDGQIRLYGITQNGAIAYERFVLTSGLRIFDDQCALCKDVTETQSAYSKENLQIITKLIQAHASEHVSVQCRQLSYDPKTNDYYVVCWAFGLHALFSSRTGECLQIFEPQKQGITSILYSQTVTGKFYTTENVTGIFKEWNVSQVKQVREIRITENSLQRAFITTTQDANLIKDVLIYSDIQGRIYIIVNQKIIFETGLNHSQAVLDIQLDPTDKSNFVTAAVDGQCRQWQMKNFNGVFENSIADVILLKTTTYNQQTQSISQQALDKSKICVCTVHLGDILICGYDNGLIIAYEQKTGRPIQNIFNPSEQLETSFYGSIYKMIAEIEHDGTKLENKLRPQAQLTELKSMYFKDNYLYTGWLDGSVRVMKISIYNAQSTGYYVSSSYTCCFNVMDITKLSREKNINVSKLQVIDNQLYVCCSGGLFFVFDLTEFQQNVANIQNVDSKDLSVAKQNKQYFEKQKYFCGNLNIKLQEGQVLTTGKPMVEIFFNNRIFNDILVTEPTQEEINFIQKKENVVANKILHLVDNFGNVATLYQLNQKAADMTFKVISVIKEEFEFFNDKFTDLNLGITFVSQVDLPFHIAYGGAEGILSLLNWSAENSQKKTVCSLSSTKSDFSCCKCYGNIMIAGCYDGSIKVISYNQTGLDMHSILQVFLKLQLNNQFSVPIEQLHQYFNKHLYQLQNFHQIVNQEVQPSNNYCPMNADLLLVRAKALTFILTYLFCQITVIDCKLFLDKYYQELAKLYQLQQNSYQDLYDKLILTYGKDLYFYNQYIQLNKQTNKLKIQKIFQFIINLSQATLDFEFLSLFLWYVGMYNESLQIAHFVSNEFVSKQAKALFQIRLISQDMQVCIAERWNLNQYFDQEYLQYIKQIKVFQQNMNTEKFQIFITSLINNNQYGVAKIIAKKLCNDPELTQFVCHQIANYYCAIGLPINACLEYMTELMYDEVIRLMLFSGEQLLLYYILNTIEQYGFDQFIGVKILILSELVFKHGLRQQILQLLDYLKQNPKLLELEDTTKLILPPKIKIGDVIGLFTLQYDNTQANSIKAKISQKQQCFIDDDYVAISHLLRKMAAAEFSQQITISTLPDEPIELDADQTVTYIQNIKSNQNKFNQQTFKILTELLEQTQINENNIDRLSAPLIFISKHFLLTNIQLDQIGNANSQQMIHLVLLAAAKVAAKAGTIRGTRVMLSGALRSQRKMNLKPLEILQKLQPLGAIGSYEHLRGPYQLKFSTQFNGRSIFSNLEQKMFGLFTPFDRAMNWLYGFLG